MTAVSTPSALVEQVWERFQTVGFTPDFGPEGSRPAYRAVPKASPQRDGPSPQMR